MVVPCNDTILAPVYQYTLFLLQKPGVHRLHGCTESLVGKDNRSGSAVLPVIDTSRNIRVIRLLYLPISGSCGLTINSTEVCHMINVHSKCEQVWVEGDGLGQVAFEGRIDVVMKRSRVYRLIA
jgi:hypothetical protein